MSNQFYNYLSNKLLNYFHENPPKPGDRFLINFDEESQVKQFLDVLGEGDVSNFSFRYHDDYDEFKTFKLNFNDVELIIADSSVTSDYLVTLRNLVSKTEGEWENKALLIISEDVKDSINEGMKNLEDEGYPFNLKYIKDSLSDDIKNSALSEIDREILEFYLKNNIENNLYKTTLWDFEYVLSIINKGFISDEDFKELDLFKDSKLGNFSAAARKSRLKNNNKLFLDNEHKVFDSDYVYQLEKKFDKKGVKELKNVETWKDADYEILKTSMDNLKDGTKSIKLELPIEVNVDSFWEKPQSDAKAGKRKRNIVIFNEEGLSEVEVTCKFNKNVDKNFLGKKNKKLVSKTKNSLTFKIPIADAGHTFYRFIYEHEKMAKNKFTFNILVLNFNKKELKNVEHVYKELDAKGNIVIDTKLEDLSFGEGDNITINIDEVNQEIDFPENHKLNIPLENAVSDINKGHILFNLNRAGFDIPFLIKNNANKPSPLKVGSLWNNKLKSKKDFVFESPLLIQDEKRYTISDVMKKTFNWEEQIISRKILNGRISYDYVEEHDLELSDDLRLAYDRLFDYYQKHNNIPSLVYLNSELRDIYQNIIDVFNKEIESIPEGSILSNNPQKLALNKIGVFESNHKVYYSPISPLNIAYQLEVAKKYSGEVRYEISKKLSPRNLLPYIYGLNNQLLSPSQEKLTNEWLVYEDIKDVSLGSTNLYLRSIVKEKLNQFVNHFNYLFKENSKAPLKINVINIDNDKEVVKGVFDFIKERINKVLIPVEVNIYNSANKTYFEELFKCRSSKDVYEKFNIKVDSGDLDPLDIIRIIQENINYSVNKGRVDEYGYAHISFYKQNSDSQHSNFDMGAIETGLSLNGLLSSCSSSAGINEYRVGYGSKYSEDSDALAVFATNLNELTFNNQNFGSNPYVKNKTIVTLSRLDSETLNKIYKNSHWVTFIEPSFSLDYLSNQKDLFILHYSDKYSASALYDTITVSDKSDQYKLIIEDFLKEYVDDFEPNEKLNDDIIKLFNSINGEWLLNLGIREYGEREKISVISAIKYALSIFENEDIIWIPIAMEEVIRLADNFGINDADGIFTVSNLIGKRQGRYSDDILLMGFNTKNAEMYYYPIEVKIGVEKDKVLDGVKEQVHSTYELLVKHLASDNSFVQKFYRNFFTQLFLTNQQKFVNNNIWPSKNFNVIDKFKKSLINEDYTISDRLKDKIGVGATILFMDGVMEQSITVDNDVAVIELPMYDGYTGIIETIDEIDDKCNEKLLDVQNIGSIGDNSLKGYKNNVPVESVPGSASVGSVSEPVVVVADQVPEPVSESVPNSVSGSVSEPVVVVADQVPEPVSNPVPGPEMPLQDVRAFIGREIKAPHKKIYWEYGNPKLSNRHILIQGKSGQGKSYFIQRMIQELSCQNIPTIVIDYTNGFRKQDLEEEFQESLGTKLKQHYLQVEDFPLNPFKKYKLQLDIDQFVDQYNSDVAGRVQAILSNVYDFGPQQENIIYNSIIAGLEEYGDDFDFRTLKDILMRDDSKTAYSIVNKASQLFDRNPFNSKSTFDWSILDDSNGEVLVIQLTGLSDTLQRVISEIILWDLWYYKSLNGNKDNPFSVVLDECQNLDFGDGSPCGKILTEGRKFGWSGWFATQSLDMFKKDAVSKFENVGEKVYFAPGDSSISNIADTLSINSNLSKDGWKTKLASLTRGHCIVKGEMLSPTNELVKDVAEVEIAPIEKKTCNIPENEYIVVDTSDLEEKIPKSPSVPKKSKYGSNIYKKPCGFMISKQINGKNREFGCFEDNDHAKIVRNFLFENDWDVKFFSNNNIFKVGDDFLVFKLIGDEVVFIAKSKDLSSAKRELESGGSNVHSNREIYDNSNFKISQSGGKFNLMINGSDDVLGRYSSKETAEFVRDILVKEYGNLEYFDNHNIFKFNDNKFLVLKLNNGQISFLGYHNSLEEAQNRINKFNQPSNSNSIDYEVSDDDLSVEDNDHEYLDDGGELEILESDGNFIVQDANQQYATFSQRWVANLFKKLLDGHEKDMSYFRNNNIFSCGTRHFVFAFVGGEIKFLGSYVYEEEARRELEKYKN